MEFLKVWLQELSNAVNTPYLFQSPGSNGFIQATVVVFVVVVVLVVVLFSWLREKISYLWRKLTSPKD